MVRPQIKLATLLRALTPTIGLLLVVSRFMWPHSRFQATNALVSGVLVFVFSVAGLLDRRWSYAAAAVGFWLASSSVFLFFLSESRATSWAEVPLGVLIIATAIAPQNRSDATWKRTDAAAAKH